VAGVGPGGREQPGDVPGAENANLHVLLLCPMTFNQGETIIRERPS